MRGRGRGVVIVVVSVVRLCDSVAKWICRDVSL